jgi:integrase
VSALGDSAWFRSELEANARHGLIHHPQRRRARRGKRPQDVQTGLHRGRDRRRLDPRELRTSFVSLMSHHGVSIEEIARLVGHASTRTTEIVYRRELRPVITTGAEIMDQLFTAT